MVVILIGENCISGLLVELLRCKDIETTIPSNMLLEVSKNVCPGLGILLL
jgi:hypothetical protein